MAAEIWQEHSCGQGVGRLNTGRGPRIIRLPGDAFQESLSEEPGEKEGTGLGRWRPDSAVQRFLVALKTAGLWVSVVHRSSPLSPRGRGE
eukprot:2367427-Heterocapsa_arctica.AAC.1